MKSVLAALFFISPITAARYGLLRVDEGPVFVKDKVETDGTKHPDLLKEDVNLYVPNIDSDNRSFTLLCFSWFRQLFDQSTDLPLPTSSFSVSMSIQLSLSMKWDGVTSSTIQTQESSSLSGQASGSTSDSTSKTTSGSPVTKNADTGKNVLLGVLLVAGVALIGAVVARKMSKHSVNTAENLSMQSEEAVEEVHRALLS